VVWKQHNNIEEQDVTDSTGSNGEKNPDFPYAPVGWSKVAAENDASVAGLTPAAEHWEAVSALQEFFSRHDGPSINSRELHDALEERFHSRGGMKYLYSLFPGGPVTQGCLVAGLEPPSGSSDSGFGSVQ
jgi:tRNA 2-thiouridine synthesizing protein E